MSLTRYNMRHFVCEKRDVLLAHRQRCCQPVTDKGNIFKVWGKNEIECRYTICDISKFVRISLLRVHLVFKRILNDFFLNSIKDNVNIVTSYL